MSALLFILVLFILVLVHELGHFIVAKKTGMRVDEFGIGFPPKLFGIKRGETTYTLNAVPLGGFVKIYGEDGSGEEGVDRNRAFGSRPLWAQALVLVAGVTANILLAWLLFTAAFTMGMKTTVDESTAGPGAKLTVLSVIADSPAFEAGIRPGDVILGVTSTEGSAETLTPSAVSSYIQTHEKVAVMLAQDGREVVHDVSTAAGLVKDDPARKVLGINMGLIEEVSKPFPTAVYEAGIFTLQSTKSVALGIVGLIHDAFLFKADLSGVAGPVGIAGLVGDAASFGLASLFMFMAFISLNLAVINVLPFPALDGGRLLFVIIEAIKGSPVKSSIAYYVNATGFVLLLILMVAVTYQDILRLF